MTFFWSLHNFFLLLLLVLIKNIRFPQVHFSWGFEIRISGLFGKSNFICDNFFNFQNFLLKAASELFFLLNYLFHKRKNQFIILSYGGDGAVAFCAVGIFTLVLACGIGRTEARIGVSSMLGVEFLAVVGSVGIGVWRERSIIAVLISGRIGIVGSVFLEAGIAIGESRMGLGHHGVDLGDLPPRSASEGPVIRPWNWLVKLVDRGHRFHGVSYGQRGISADARIWHCGEQPLAIVGRLYVLRYGGLLRPKHVTIVDVWKRATVLVGRCFFAPIFCARGFSSGTFFATMFSRMTRWIFGPPRRWLGQLRSTKFHVLFLSPIPSQPSVLLDVIQFILTLFYGTIFSLLFPSQFTYRSSILDPQCPADAAH